MTAQNDGSSLLTQLGQHVAAPTSPEEAILERVPAPYPGRNYTVRFTSTKRPSLLQRLKVRRLSNTR